MLKSIPGSWFNLNCRAWRFDVQLRSRSECPQSSFSLTRLEELSVGSTFGPSSSRLATSYRQSHLPFFQSSSLSTFLPNPPSLSKHANSVHRASSSTPRVHRSSERLLTSSSHVLCYCYSLHLFLLFVLQPQLRSSIPICYDP